MLEELEQIAQAELSERFGERVRFEGAARPGALSFSSAGELADLLALRSVVAVYGVQYFAVPRPKALLGNQQFGELSGAISAVIELAPAGAYATLRLSAAGKILGADAPERPDAQRFGLAVAADEGDLLIRLRRAGRRWLGNAGAAHAAPAGHARLAGVQLAGRAECQPGLRHDCADRAGARMTWC